MIDFKELLKQINIDINDEKLEKFETYYNYLIEVNEYMNLTAITKKEEVYIKHFYDSILFSQCVKFNDNDTLLDVGSGAGFPSIPLAIIFDNVNFTIIDALQKRINFLNDLIKKLGLKNVKAIHARAEDFAKDNRETFDYVTARAVARLNVLSELCIPLVKLNGKFIALKSNNKEEIIEGKKAINLLGCKFLEEYDFKLPCDLGDRSIYTYLKVSQTPSKYPRPFKDIKSKPIGGNKNV